MLQQRWTDQSSAMRELEAIHRKHWVAATRDEFAQYCIAHPVYQGGMPYFVTDQIRQFRCLSSKYAGVKLRSFYEDEFPAEYLEALSDYVQQFSKDLTDSVEISEN